MIFAIALLRNPGDLCVDNHALVRYFRFTKPAYPIKDLPAVLGNDGCGLWSDKDIQETCYWIFSMPSFSGVLRDPAGQYRDGDRRALWNRKIPQGVGILHDIIMASVDVFAFLVAVSIIVFLCRRVVFFR